MLKLSEAQWQELLVRDSCQFVEAVCKQFLATRPDVLEKFDPAVIQEAMQKAHDYALAIGFQSSPHVVRFMYLGADAPSICSDAIISAYLRKPGATPEQRLDDLLAVTDKKLKEKH